MNMRSAAYKSDNKTNDRAIANSPCRQKAESGGRVQFVDNRSETLELKSLQSLISQNSMTPIQSKIKIGTTLYEKGKRNRSSGTLIGLVEQEEIKLRRGWKTYVKNTVNKPEEEPYYSFDSFLDYLEKKFKPKKSSRKRKRKRQNKNIVNIFESFPLTRPERKKARILTRESGKAFSSILEKIRDLKEYKETEEELKKITFGKRSEKTDFKTKNPFLLFDLLPKYDNKLDYNLQGVSIETHGFELRKDRTVDPKTLKQPFGYGTVKIGPNIGTYENELKKNEPPEPYEMEVLNNLEKFRLPQLAPMFGLKRYLYEKGKLSKKEGFGSDSKFSNVEFLGAVTGSGLKKVQKENMRKQQVFSNMQILKDSYERFPDEEIGYQTTDKKPRVIPKKLFESLNDFSSSLNTKKIKPKKKKKKKKKLRKLLSRSILSTSKISDVDSDGEVSDVEDQDYNDDLFFNF